MRVIVSLYPRQHLVLSVFWIFAILTGVQWYLVLIHNSLIAYDVEMGFSLNNPELHFFFFYQPTLKCQAPRDGDTPESQALLCHWLAIGLGKSLTNLDLFLRL